MIAEPRVGNEVHRIVHYAYGGKGNRLQQARPALRGGNRVLVRDAFNTDQDAVFFRRAREAVDGVREITKRLFGKGLRITGTVGVAGAGFSRHDGRAEITGQRQVILEQHELAFPLRGIRMDGIDVAAEHGEADAVQRERFPGRGGKRRIEKRRIACKTGQGLGQGELDAREAVCGDPFGKLGDCVEFAKIMRADAKIDHK